ARLNGNGSLDTTFTPGTGANDTVWALAVQTNGNVVIAGQFTSYNTTNRHYIARVQTNGLVDATFDPGQGPDAFIHTIAVQPDGKSIIDGLCDSYNQTRRIGLARVSTDGTIDTTFMDTSYNQFAGVPNEYWSPATQPRNFIFATGIQSDGNIIVSGSFSRIGGGGARDAIASRNNITRVIGGSTPGPGLLQLAQ